jgi:hypothetical protein
MRRGQPSAQLFGKPYAERRKPHRGRSIGPTEYDEHVIVADWLRAKGLLWLHPANGEARNIVTGARLKRMGVSKGASDFIIFTQPPGKHGITGVAIEMKRAGATPSSVSKEQRDWLDALTKEGWRTCVAFGADDAIAFLGALYGK